MSAGFFAVDRGIFDNPSFAAEPFTQREAWMWLVAQRQRINELTEHHVDSTWRERTARTAKSLKRPIRG